MRELKDVDTWYQKNKITNLQLAIKQLNGIVLRQGDTFSYWKLIGQPTKKRVMLMAWFFIMGSLNLE